MVGHELVEFTAGMWVNPCAMRFYYVSNERSIDKGELLFSYIGFVFTAQRDEETAANSGEIDTAAYLCNKKPLKRNALIYYGTLMLRL